MARDGERGRGDWKARRGSHDSDPYADASEGTGSVDIAAVRRDDALIDAISGDGPVSTDSPEEYQLASVLANWRAGIVEEPLPAGPDLDSVVAAVNQEIGAREARVNVGGRSYLRLVRPLMGAAAAVALIFGGMTAFSYSAEPGDPLWRVKEVVFSQQAQTTIAQRADQDLTTAQNLIAEGRPEQAQPLLEGVQHSKDQVDGDQRKSELSQRWDKVVAELNARRPDIAASLAPEAPHDSTGRPQPWQPGRPGHGAPTTTPDMGILRSSAASGSSAPSTTPNESGTSAPSSTPGSSESDTPSTTVSPSAPRPTGSPSNTPTAEPSSIASTGASIPEYPSGHSSTSSEESSAGPTVPQVGPTTVVTPR